MKTVTIGMVGEKSKRVEVADVRAAVAKVLAYRDETAMASSEMCEGFGEVRENGKVVAVVHYNGTWSSPDHDLARRIKAATIKADEAFWEVIADAFPEATNGDLDPGSIQRMESASLEAVKAWVSFNVPGTKSEEA